MKIGRNQPCPCGSGKKYKKCCMAKEAEPSQALYYRRLSEAHDRLVDRLMSYADRTCGEDALGAAMDEFLLWPESDDDVSKEMIDRTTPLFWPWYLFNWEHNSRDDGLNLAMPENRTIAELYAEKHGSKLNPVETRFLESVNRKPYSFLQVVDVDPGEGMALQDIFMGSRIAVQEQSGSDYVKPGDILFGRAVSVDGVGMLVGLSPMIIPQGRKPEMIRLRKRMRRYQPDIGDDDLYQWDTEIRQLYLDIDRSLHTAPKMSNTDGHVLEFHRLVYEIHSAEDSFEALCGLCVTESREELYADAKQDDDGRIIEAEIPWNRLGNEANPGMPNTLLGRIVIKGNRLTAEVNSAERAVALRSEIDARLGSGGRFIADEIQDMDAMMRRHASGEAERKSAKEQEELMQHPEVREQVAEMLSRHWESWVDQKIPALDGKTPKEAVKTADGRESVEALLQDAENDRRADPLTAEANRKGTQRVRKLLGLKSPPKD